MTRRRPSALPAAVGAVLLAVAALLVPAAPAAAAESDTVYSLVNDARWANGQAGLVRNAELDQVAADWAAKLAASGTLAHNPDYAAQIPGGWTNAGENVAQGQADAGSMHAAWMASAGHRANILGAYTDVGVAFLAAGGTTWGVQVFASYPGSVGPPAPGTVSGSQVATSPAPGEAADAEVVTVAPTPTLTPTATTTSDDTGTTEVIEFTRDEEPSSPPWGIAGLAAVVAVGGVAFWWIRRRRATS